MMQKRSLYSLLLTSFMLVIAFSLSVAQEVTFESKTVYRCEEGVLNIEVNNPSSISALEIVFEVSEGSGGAFFDALDVVWDDDFNVLLHRYIDLSQVDNASPDVVRIAGMMTETGDDCLGVGPTVVAQVEYTTNNVCDGEIILDGTTWTVDPGGYALVTETQFVDCATTTIVPAAVIAGTVTIVNAPPTIAAIGDDLVLWGDTYIGLAEGDDLDLLNGCESLTYSKVSGPADLTVNATTGAITWVTEAADMIADCQFPVEVQVEDECGATASTTFTIYLWNDTPIFVDCPDEITNVFWGYEATGSVDADDPDTGPAPLSYSLASFDGPGSVTVNAANGDWSWSTLEDPAYLGVFELCIAVTDGAAIGCGTPTNPSNADTCCVEINVISTLDIVIEKSHDVIQGKYDYVSITVENSDLLMGGFDFLVAYDASALTFAEATPGQLLEDCGWEYFTYRYGADGNCGNACPSGLLRIVAIAETNNGMNHPTCFGPPDFDPHELAEMKFFVTDDRTFECQYVPIKFFWGDCGDNAVSSKTGDTLYLDRAIYTFEDNLVWDEDDDGLFPESNRIPYVGAPDYCLNPDPEKPTALRAIDFKYGGIDIICADSIDARGDINLNGLSNEIADAVLFTNYFVHGLSVFNVNVDGQIAASDVNADGVTLSVADLVYQIRIIVGDASPYMKVAPVSVDYAHAENGALMVDGIEIGAAFVIAEGNVTPELTVPNMEMKYAFNGINTRILVYSLVGNSTTGQFLNVEGDIISIEMATREGNPVSAKLRPNNFALNQNYPNPFNPTTTISFTLPVASDYTLTIYNVSGQTVTTLSGTEQAGTVVREWDAGDLASGIYFYKLQADNFTDTKKMVLLK
ncbi:MAG: T9SS type A sorting domain-containing protein [candidate division Zixibacteria bacterium]|nr:T9SS type A sorting domain-containing protein [candidate division Zixibacteria bacterium]